MIRIPSLAAYAAVADWPGMRPSINPDAFAALLSAHRAKAKRFSVVIKDSLAPDDDADLITPGSIGQVAQLLAHLSPPAAGVSIRTMAPDARDRKKSADDPNGFDPALLHIRLVPAICSVPGWEGAGAEPVSRLDCYEGYGEADLVFRTADKSPYGNIWMELNVGESNTFAAIHPGIDPKLAAKLLRAGHHNTVVIAPETWRREGFGADAGPWHKVFTFHGSVREAASALTSLWYPDTYDQPHKSKLGGGFGVSAVPGEWMGDLDSKWRDTRPQPLSRADVKELALERRVSAIVFATPDAAAPDALYVLANGTLAQEPGL